MMGGALLEDFKWECEIGNLEVHPEQFMGEMLEKGLGRK